MSSDINFMYITFRRTQPKDARRVANQQARWRQSLIGEFKRCPLYCFVDHYIQILY